MTIPYTNQTAFDKVCERLFDGKGQCIGTEGCLYRRSDGNKCAIGYLIEDKDYDVSIEDSSVKYITLPCYLQEVDLDLLNALQVVHDKPIHWTVNTFNDYGLVSLKQVAIAYNLILPDNLKISLSRR